MQRQRTYFARNSIRFQLFRLVVAVTAAALVVSMVGGALFEWNNQQQRVRQSLATIAQAAGVAGGAAIAFHDRIAAGEALRILAAQKEIEAAALYPLEGYRLASYGDDARLPDNVDQLREHLPDFSLFLPSTTLFQPIRLDDSTIGYIFIRASLRDYHRTFLLQAALAIGTSLLGLLLVLALGLRFLDRIVKPVKELADTARQVREDKNFSLRVTPPAASVARDEIGELIVSFNAMLAEIEQRERELASYHNRLERMVLERTEALQAANLELQAAKEAAEGATVSKSRFLAAASHDLRQPAHALGLFVSRLAQTPLSAESRDMVRYIETSVASLQNMLDTLLDLSRIDVGQIQPRPGVFRADELLARLHADHAAAARQQGLRLRLKCAPLWLHTDAVLLARILMNFLSNALRYTRHGGVLLACRRRGDHALLQVWDTGIGIPAESRQDIFGEYVQLANPERDRSKGLGLGLAICERLAKLLGLAVGVRSVPGRGSVFWVEAPLAPAGSEAAAERVQVREAGMLAGTVLVVAGDPLLQASLVDLVSSWGCSTIAAASAAEALAHCEGAARPDLVICDTPAGSADVMDAVLALRLRLGKIPVLLLTAAGQGRHAGAVGPHGISVLGKPLQPARLRALLQHLLAGESGRQ